MSIQEKANDPEDNIAAVLSSMEEELVDEMMLETMGVADRETRLEM